MNCMNQKVRRNKEAFIRKEYQDKLAALTPEERKAAEQRGRDSFNRLFGALNAIKSGTYSDLH